MVNIEIDAPVYICIKLQLFLNENDGRVAIKERWSQKVPEEVSEGVKLKTNFLGV